MNRPDFGGLTSHASPFPHFRVPALIDGEQADSILDWLDADAPWSLRIAPFYEQHEFSLVGRDLPPAAAELVSPGFTAEVGRHLAHWLGAGELALVDVCAHRLEAGQTIRIHNDHIGAEETHRLVLQLNRGWTVEQGGLLMLFERDDPASVTDVMLPTHRGAFGFEISDRSHHAVSTIHAGRRDSLVFTYRKSV